MRLSNKKPLYVVLARTVGAYKRCSDPSANTSQADWGEKHEAYIEKLVKEHMPSGSGIDTGTVLDIERSTEKKLVFTFSYHHMDECGGYNGWTDHKLTVKGSLAFGFELAIGGRDRNDVKDYLHEVYHSALSIEVDEFSNAGE